MYSIIIPTSAVIINYQAWPVDCGGGSKVVRPDSVGLRERDGADCCGWSAATRLLSARREKITMLATANFCVCATRRKKPIQRGYQVLERKERIVMKGPANGHDRRNLKKEQEAS